MTDLRKAPAQQGKASLRLAAEMALEALETLWNILDDIDTASDMAKENDAWYRKRVEALQKKRWDTMITTDGYKLKGGPVEALRQALAQDALQKLADIDHSLGLFIDSPTAKREQEPVECMCGLCKLGKREWVGLTDEDKEFISKRAYVYDWHDYEVIEASEAKLKEKNT